MTEIATSVPELTTVDEPLLSPTQATALAPSAGGDRPPSRVPMLLGLFAGRRGASMVVRQNVALQLEDYREAWGYSLPVVVIETLWNLAFVVVSFVTLFWIAREEDNAELRVWICGYSMLCVVNAVLVVLEYMRRNGVIATAPNSVTLTITGPRYENELEDLHPIRKCELLTTVIYSMWWALGFGWMLFTYDHHGTPLLFWLTLAFLATDVFFLALRIILYIFLSAAFCFCLPCIIVFMHYINSQERASEAEISSLPKYRYEVSNGDVGQPDNRACRMIPMGTNGQDFSTERVLRIENADCCICLCQYEDGEQLLLLPCDHHFHSTCIVKWLMLKATCPLCKVLVAPNE
ncbi:E3 ubiquitin protein ligase RIE1 [Helianthus annuus]|nr:E3 ubiquitin protein ligase RIE1 [Helianthus annuus]